LNITAAARKADVKRSTFTARMKRLGISKRQEGV
jgi:transcriptional regulator of acetoin/glycerol metabolism